MAEREGFEPSDPVRDHLISSQARSAAPASLQVTLSSANGEEKSSLYRKAPGRLPCTPSSYLIGSRTHHVLLDKQPFPHALIPLDRTSN